MCRLYGFISTHPRKVECELIQSQNSLVRQSLRDMRGEQNPHGWGIGNFEKKQPHVVKQPKAAFDSDEFRWQAAEIHSKQVISHVRRATVGIVSMENTHPFAHHELMLAHNGHIDNFTLVRDLILSALSEEEQGRIQGNTDSEHILGYSTGTMLAPATTTTLETGGIPRVSVHHATGQFVSTNGTGSVIV